MANLTYYDIIKKSLLFEKSMIKIVNKKYTFIVHKDTIKNEVFKTSYSMGKQVLGLKTRNRKNTNKLIIKKRKLKFLNKKEDNINGTFIKERPIWR